MSVSQEVYDDLLRQREDALQRGNFHKALEFCEHALQTAHQLGSQDLVHRAVYSRSAIHLIDGGRIFSAYHLDDGTKIWIITESDRSSTCVLLPSEY